MSNSELLRKTTKKMGGGKHIFNEEAKTHEINLKNIIPIILTKLEKDYPGIVFQHQNKISKMEISKVVNPKKTYIPQAKNSFITPDGGMIYALLNGEKYPIIISEAKKQGTNIKRINEGLKKQSKGNAIERAYKNIEEIKLYTNKLNYFPYIIFAFGCDFENGSSILDRLDAMTKYEPRNTNYVDHLDQKVTIYVREKSFTKKEIIDKMYQVAETSLKCIGVKK